LTLEYLCRSRLVIGDGSVMNIDLYQPSFLRNIPAFASLPQQAISPPSDSKLLASLAVSPRSLDKSYALNCLLMTVFGSVTPTCIPEKSSWRERSLCRFPSKASVIQGFLSVVSHFGPPGARCFAVTMLTTPHYRHPALSSIDSGEPIAAAFAFGIVFEPQQPSRLLSCPVG
jgi:hypothetical protein